FPMCQVGYTSPPGFPRGSEGAPPGPAGPRSPEVTDADARRWVECHGRATTSFQALAGDLLRIPCAPEGFAALRELPGAWVGAGEPLCSLGARASVVRALTR